MAVTVHASLVGEAVAVVAHEDDAALAPFLAAQGDAAHGLLLAEALLHHRAARLVVGEGVAVQDAERLIGLHVPLSCADLDAHAHAVAVVVHAADGHGASDAQVVLKHLGVVLKAAAGKHDAVVGAHVERLAVALELHADDRLGLRVLNEVLGGRGAPHVDAVGALDDVLADELVQGGVIVALVHEHLVHRVAALILGVLGGDDGAVGPAEQVLLGNAQVLHVGLHVAQGVGVGAQGLLVAVEVPEEAVLVVLEHLVGVVACDHHLTGNAAVAALLALGGAVAEQDACAVVGRVDGGGATGGAVADDNDVVLSVPGDGVGEGDVGSLGEGGGYAAGCQGADRRGGGTCDERATRESGAHGCRSFLIGEGRRCCAAAPRRRPRYVPAARSTSGKEFKKQTSLR